MIGCPDFGDQADFSEPAMCAKGSSSVVEPGNAELDLWSGPFDDGIREDSDKLDEETAIVDSNIELWVCPPELTVVKGDTPSFVDVGRDTSGKEECDDPSLEVNGMKVCVDEVLFPLKVQLIDSIPLLPLSLHKVYVYTRERETRDQPKIKTHS
jgi:hypothetical protein